MADKHLSFQVGIDMLNAGISRLSKNAELYLARGVLYCQMSDSTRCIGDLETANHLDPNLAFVGAAQGIAQSQAHHSSQALATLRAAALRHPNEALTQYLLAEALFEQGLTLGRADFDEALVAANAAVKINPKLTEAHDLLASIYLQSNKNNLSIEQSQAALAIDPQDQQALYHLLLAERKSRDKADVASTVQRLMKARSEAQQKRRKSMVYKLVEPSSPGVRD